MIRLSNCTVCQKRTPHKDSQWHWHLGERLDWPDHASGEETTCLRCATKTYTIIEYDQSDEWLRDIPLALSVRRPMHSPC